MTKEIKVYSGGWALLSYEYANTYVFGFCSRNGFNIISGSLVSDLGFTIQYDYMLAKLSIKAPSGGYGCSLFILDPRNAGI